MRYQSFRLQVWRSDRFGLAQWSALLEGPQGGRHVRFTNTDALLSHLHTLLTLDQHAGAQPSEPSENETSWPFSQRERKIDDE
jgi:hypothetical protein